jgi:hypothetical protein
MVASRGVLRAPSGPSPGPTVQRLDPEALQGLAVFSPQNSSTYILELTCPEPVEQDTMVAMLGSAPPCSGLQVGAGGSEEKAVLEKCSPSWPSSSFSYRHGRMPVSIMGPSLTLSPRPGDPQWLLPHQLAGKRPTVQGTQQGGWGLVTA